MVGSIPRTDPHALDRDLFIDGTRQHKHVDPMDGFGPPAVVPLCYEQCGAEVDVDVVTPVSVVSEMSIENRKPRFNR